MNLSGAVYVGKCHKCNALWEAQFLVKKHLYKKNSNPISPPVIIVSCQCEVPVIPVDLIYFKAIST